MQSAASRRWHLIAVVASVLSGVTLLSCGGDGGSDADAEIAVGAATMRQIVFVANAEEGTVTAVDSRTFEVLRDYDVLPDGPDAELGEDDPAQALIGQAIVEAAGGDNFAQDLDVSPDGLVLYVSRGHRGDVAAFDIESGGLLWKVPVSSFRADHMTISEDGRRLYVSAMDQNQVEVIDTEAAEVIAAIPAGQWAHDNHISEDGQRLYNSSIGNLLIPREMRSELAAGTDALSEVVLGPPLNLALGTVTTPPYQLTVVDTASFEVVDTHHFEAGIRPWVLAEEGRRFYAQLSCFHGLIEYDMENREILRRLELPVAEAAEGLSCDDVDFEAPHHGLALSPDERQLCAAARASNYVALVSREAFDREAARIIPVGEGPGWATNDVAGTHCWVPSASGTVSAISYADAEEVARIPTGTGAKYAVAARVPEPAICARSRPPSEWIC